MSRIKLIDRSEERRVRKAIPGYGLKKKGMSIVLSEETKAQLEKVADKLKRPPAQLVRVIIEEWLENNVKGE